MTADRWWDRERHAARRAALLRRNRIKAAIRGWFEAQRFVEVETAVLQISPGNETHLHAFATELVGGDDRSAPMFLRTSPEFAAKKLLAAGEMRIFEFARVFRNRERTRLNVPEFTMLEWYRSGEVYAALMIDAIEILRIAAGVARVKALAGRYGTADPYAKPEETTVAEAFRREAGIDLLATLHPDGSPRRNALAEMTETVGINVVEDDSWSDIFTRVMAERIEPKLGQGRPTLLTDYPAPEAALARPKPSDPRLAERFEMFVAGVELANGFSELTDPDEQRRRFEQNMAEKQDLYGERYPIDEDFLAALAEMPPAAGVALGFDRLVMLCVGAERIDDVQWSPVADPLAEP